MSISLSLMGRIIPSGALAPDEQEVAAVVAGLADVGVLRRLFGGDHHQPFVNPFYEYMT